MPTDIFAIKDTYSLVQAVELIKKPASFLVDTFFPQKLPTAPTSFVAVEYRKGKKTLAPYIVKGAKGVNIARDGSNVRYYAAPMVAPRRVISMQDIELRQFGEAPIYSQMTPAERAAAMQARDFNELLAMIQNRKNKMAADILQTGKTTIKGYADDGQTVEIDEINFNFGGLLPVSNSWSNAAADIYGNIYAAVEKIGEDTGELPTVMLCGKNVERALLKNNEIKDWLMIPNRENLAMMSLTPNFQSPNVRYIGNLQSLGLEVYSYLETFTDDDGTVKPFLDPNTVIIATPGKGKQLSGAITLLNGATKQFETVIAEYVPHYSVNEESMQTSLTIFSRFLLVPDVIDSWATLKVIF